MPYGRHMAGQQSQGRYRNQKMMNQRDLNTIEEAINLLGNSLKTFGPAIDGTKRAKEFLTLQMAGLEHEVFGVMFLNTQSQLIEFEILFTGTINQAAVYPREVAKRALLHNATSVILAHNHPSGHNKPSEADKSITEALRDGLGLLDIRVLDHIIVAHKETFSFADNGLM